MCATELVQIMHLVRCAVSRVKNINIAFEWPVPWSANRKFVIRIDGTFLRKWMQYGTMHAALHIDDKITMKRTQFTWTTLLHRPDFRVWSPQVPSTHLTASNIEDEDASNTIPHCPSACWLAAPRVSVVHVLNLLSSFLYSAMASKGASKLINGCNRMWHTHVYCITRATQKSSNIG